MRRLCPALHTVHRAMSLSCPRHGGNGGAAIDIYDWRNVDTKQSCILWVDQNCGLILCQTATTTSSFHGSFVEEEPHPRAGSVFRLSFRPDGDEGQLETYVVMATSNHLYVGLSGQGRNVEMLWRRKMQMCAYCGDWYLAEASGTENVPAILFLPPPRVPPATAEDQGFVFAGDTLSRTSAGSTGVTTSMSTDEADDPSVGTTFFC